MNTILNLLQVDGITPRRMASTHGGEYKSPCPVCGGKDRFMSWPARSDGVKQTWWCRQCDKGGDEIEYLRYVRGMSYKETCNFLGKNPRPVNWRSAHQKQETTWKPRKIAPPKNIALWEEKASAFIKWAVNKLWDNRSASVWNRLDGLTEKTIRHFHLGYNPKTFYRPREDWGMMPELKENGKPKKLWLPAGLVIPYMEGDKPVQIKIRLTDPNVHQKYISIRSGAPCLVPCVGECFVVVESDLDAMLLWQEAGNLVGIVSLGSLASPDTKTTALLSQARVVLVALDNDQPGVKKAWGGWPKYFPKSRRWPVPKKYGKDPGEAYLNGLDLRVWVKAGIEDRNEARDKQYNANPAQKSY